MNREFSVEDGFQIVMIFLRDLWWKFLKNLMINKGIINQEEMSREEREVASVDDKIKDVLHFHNSLFFLTVCDGTSDDYFEKVIEKKMKIPPIKQHGGLIVKEDILFQLANDFCDYFNRRYQEQKKDSLRFAIKWLEDMRKNPKAHKIEWDLWNQTIIDVTENGQKSFSFF